MAAYAIDACNLTKVFPGDVTAVNGLNLRVRRGSVYGLIGPNGAGKTTALRLLMGLLRPGTGTARILGHDLWNAPRSVRSRVVYISQTQQLHGWMTLQELCRYASHHYELWDQAHAHALANSWRLPLDRRIGSMSVGDQRKAGLVIAFAARPEVLLLDEPASGLDPIARRSLIQQVIETAGGGEDCTVLFSTHLLEDLERVVDSVGIMDRGHLIVSSPLDELKSTVKRVQVVFPGDTVPRGFVVPGAVWSENSGPVATAVTRLINEAQLDPIQHMAGARVHVFPLNLEDILLAFFREPASGPESRWDAQPASEILDEKAF